MPDMPLTPDELLTTTRSVRKRLDLTRPVPLDLVKECLEIALQAPSGGMRQGWHWIVVTDPEVSARAMSDVRVAAHLARAGVAGPLLHHRQGDALVERGYGRGVPHGVLIPGLR